MAFAEYGFTLTLDLLTDPTNGINKVALFLTEIGKASEIKPLC